MLYKYACIGACYMTLMSTVIHIYHVHIVAATSLFSVANAALHICLCRTLLVKLLLLPPCMNIGVYVYELVCRCHVYYYCYIRLLMQLHSEYVDGRYNKCARLMTAATTYAYFIQAHVAS
jgi:hypothetical protein